MKYLLIGLVLLSGCASWDHYRNNKGYEDGKRYNKNGYNDKSEYYIGFYSGFLRQNLMNR